MSQKGTRCLERGMVAPAVFPNGSQLEVHGKLFEKIVDPDVYTYLNIDGIPNMTLNITFDDDPIPSGTRCTSGDPMILIEPFEMGCNGTFMFLLDIDKPAGVHELTVNFARYPPNPPYHTYPPLNYTTKVYVNHPTVVGLGAIPTSIVVGETLSVTDRIEREAEAIIAKVDDMGGMVKAIERGWPQRVIHESAYRHQMAVEAGGATVVGVNAYQIDEGPRADVLRVDPEVGAKQRAGLAQLRATRDAARVTDALAAVREAARGTANMMPPILEAVEALATLGEVCAVLREEWDEYRPPSFM